MVQVNQKKKSTVCGTAAWKGNKLEFAKLSRNRQNNVFFA